MNDNIVVCILLGNSPASEFIYANVLEHSVCSIFIGGVGLPMKMGETECSETLAYKIQTSANYPEESIQHSEHSESLKSIIITLICKMCIMFVCVT